MMRVRRFVVVVRMGAMLVPLRAQPGLHVRHLRLPVSVITGFLGSGKTTLLNRLLRDPDMSDSAVIINEWGEVGLDHLLVETLDGDLDATADPPARRRSVGC